MTCNYALEDITRLRYFNLLIQFKYVIFYFSFAEK